MSLKIKSKLIINPGPGNYNILSMKLKPAWNKPKMICFFKGAESCLHCEQNLFGDYYKDTSGKLILCLNCYRKVKDPIRETPSFMQKFRHCSAYHQHIDVENIVYHKTTLKKIRRLTMLEKSMWNKFGEMLDHKGLPE